MSWWKRWWQTWTSSKRSPSLSLDDLRSQLQTQLEEHQRLLLEEMHRSKRLETALQKEETLASQWEKRAILGVRIGDDNLAREALHHHQRHLRKARMLRQEVRLQGLHLKRVQQWHDAFVHEARPLLERAEVLTEQKTERAARHQAALQLEQEQWQQEMALASDALERLESEWQGLQDEEAAQQEHANEELQAEAVHWRVEAEEEFEARLAALEARVQKEKEVFEE